MNQQEIKEYLNQFQPTDEIEAKYHDECLVEHDDVAAKDIIIDEIIIDIEKHYDLKSDVIEATASISSLKEFIQEHHSILQY